MKGGVGCSPNCRCEGCKNTFGSKNGQCLSYPLRFPYKHILICFQRVTGVEENELEGVEPEELEKKFSDVTSRDMIEEGEEEHADRPIPSETARFFPLTQHLKNPYNILVIDTFLKN